MKCEDCQLACYDLLDQTLSAKDEREVLAHIERCPQCRAFLEEEGKRKSQWPRLLCEATRTATMPTDAAERVTHAFEVSRGKSVRRQPKDGRNARVAGWLPHLSAFAAVALIVLSLGGAVWLMAERLQRTVLGAEAYGTASGTDQAIRVLGQKQVKRLDLPSSLPGVVKLAEGEIVLRLQTGVELTVLGPAELDVRDGMLVRLGRGRLLARVPRWAVGFTVKTQQFDVHDLGTVFGVSVDDSGSGAFVFKGSVRIDETGEHAARTPSPGAGICKAGEGIMAKINENPMRFAADCTDAQTLFGEVKGCAALRNPVRAWQVFREIVTLRAERAAQTVPGGTTSCSNGAASASAPLSACDGCGLLPIGMSTVTNELATDLYFSASGSGYAAWDAGENWRVYQGAGGGVSGRLPSGADTVRINAATLAAEQGSALVITNGINAICDSFASGYKGYPGTVCLRMEGGSLKSRTAAVIGMNYPALAILESGELSCGIDLYIGGYGNPAGHGIVTNNGATITALRLHMGHEANTFGRLVHRGGTLDCQATDSRSSLQVGFDGGVGEFVAEADFSANVMGIGYRSASSFPLGTGSVTVAEGATGVVNSHLHVDNGALNLKGGTILFPNTGGTLTNLYVRQNAEGQAMICGWGLLASTDTRSMLRMINNGTVIADGAGVERDLDFSPFAVVNNDLPNGSNGASGWYAVNRGRVLFPRTYRQFSAAAPYCLGDLYTRPAPELVNSVGFTFTSQTRCVMRGGYCATDRDDIPGGLPAHLRPIGVWCIGAYAANDFQARTSFPSIGLTFRYDHTRLRATDRLLQLFRYDGEVWARVGTCRPGGDNRISTDAPLAPVAEGAYSVGWFAVMAAERKGTVISIF